MKEIMSNGLTLDDTARLSHDLLMSVMPSGASHDANLCPFCSSASDGEEENTESTAPQGGDMSKYTEEDLQAAIAEATKPLQDALNEIKASQDQAAIEARISEVTAAAEAEKADLQAKLDAVNVELAAAKAQYDDLVALLEAEDARVAQEAALAARRDEVTAQVKERTALSEAYIAENIDRWVAMDAEAFAALLDGWAEIGKSNSGANLNSTAMQASREDESTQDVGDARRQLLKNRSAVRSIGARNY